MTTIDIYRRKQPLAPRFQAVSVDTAATDRELSAFDDEAIDKAMLGSLDAAQRHRFTISLSASERWPEECCQIKHFSVDRPLPLRHAVKVLDHFGLSVDDYRAIEFRDEHGELRYMQVFVCVLKSAPFRAASSGTDKLVAALSRAWYGASEVDALCQLVVSAQVNDLEIDILRAYCAYLRQIGVAFSLEFLTQALIRHPDATAAILHYFDVRFNPQFIGERTTAMQEAGDACRLKIHRVGASEEQRICRLLMGCIAATVRTNAFRTEAQRAPVLAFKLQSAAVPEIPSPRPRSEFFVYSSRLEGIYLRGDKVARGGIRCSERRHDLRTELQALYKAQLVKNTIISPAGAQGGFVVKQTLADGDPRDEVGDCYRAFLGGLLDVTDNLLDGKVKAPPQVVRHDCDDPYLVVAADQGTTCFTAHANDVAAAYGFWLGDAFATGGASGFDHQALGIAPRAAWQAVEQHLRGLNIDPMQQEISVCSVSDSLAQCFGAGLVTLPRIRLLAAFDQHHILVDPLSNVLAAAAERHRLSALPEASWGDFSPAALGAGGAVYSRHAQRISLSPETQRCFGLSAECSPVELIRAILSCDVDLLWFSGSGNYIQASAEPNLASCEISNDAWCVPASSLRCRVIGESANHALTQRARIEFAQAGGRINTDAIDNAGTVCCSDREVNLKILLSSLQRAGQLDSTTRQNLLQQMRGEVTEQVLRDVGQQAQAISVAEHDAPRELDRHARLLRYFGRAEQIDRPGLALPDEIELGRRREQRQGLCRPELAVLLAHTKITLFSEFISSTLPDEPLLDDDLLAYFPAAVRNRFPEAIRQHPLRREIITTAVINSMVSRVGSGFVNDLQERTGASDPDIARAYLAARRLLKMEALWGEIEVVATAAGGNRHLHQFKESREIVEVMTLWLLQRAAGDIDICGTVSRFSCALDEMRCCVEKSLNAETVAERLRALRVVCDLLDLLLIAESGSQNVILMTKGALALQDVLAFPSMLEALKRLAAQPGPASLAAAELTASACTALCRIAARCATAERKAEAGIQRSLVPRRARLARYHAWRSELHGAEKPEIAVAVLAVEALRALA